MHGVAARDGVVLQEVIKQAGQRGELAADGDPGQASGFKLGAPGLHVRMGDGAKFIGAGEADKTAEVFQIVLVGAAGARVVDIGEPFHRWRPRGQLVVLGRAQAAFAGSGGNPLAHRTPGPAGRPAACSAATHAQHLRMERSFSDSGTCCCQRSCSSVL